MSYQVLARKWRPRRFAELIGQEHVVRALVNALEQGRLHHAFLFTGTRGVGKTTVARILAKALNCENGVSAEPCGECSSCTEIDAGRFLDLIEVDAASRTKVDETRELLDNVQFTPARGRYKVYLIDEVHMFSNHSFNALLKTLEEPPPHVKFLFATTDPQKLPMTILSRCLQFNLKRLPVDLIAGQLQHILDAEGVGFEAPALVRLARAADGSMRDGLSLLDQAIAFGGGAVSEEDTRTLLGDVGSDKAGPLLEALADGDAAGVLAIVAALAERIPDFSALIDELQSLLHRVAVVQAQPDADDPALPEHERVVALAGRLPPEDVQLFYQIALLGRRDLPLAPDPRRGCEMTLLRMLAFRPVEATPGSGKEAAPRSAERPPRGPEATAEAPRQPRTAPVREEAAPAAVKEPPAAAAPPAQPSKRPVPPPPAGDTPPDWIELAAALNLVGMVRQLANHCALVGWDGELVTLRLDPGRAQLRTERSERALAKALSDWAGRKLRLVIEESVADTETPAAREERERAERQHQAEQAIATDPHVESLRQVFDAEVEPGSVRPTR